MIQEVQRLVADNQGWTWTTLIGTALMSWIAPVAGLVTIGLGVLQGYIAWQKFKAWKEDRKRGRTERSAGG